MERFTSTVATCTTSSSGPVDNRGSPHSESANGGLRSRAVNGAARILNGELHHLKGLGGISRDSGESAVSSGRSTPIPEDAPPSVRSIKHARRERRRRLFPTVDYENRVSHFDPDSTHRDFRGFFTLFWIGLAIMVVTAGLKNLRDTGTLLRTSIFSLFRDDLWRLGFAELGMVSSTLLCLPAQQIFQKRTLVWEKEGYLLQHLAQLIWLGAWVYLPFYLNWQWTHQVFFTLHALVLLMKVHSYSFYSGHLSTTQQRLRALDANNVRVESKEDAELREALAFELTSPNGQVTYPQNLTLENFLDYLLCPTLCYELSYPRTEKIRWGKLAEKAVAVFGCLFLLTVTSEEFIYPVMVEAAAKLEHAVTVLDGAIIVLESISLLLFPFMVTFLLVFLVIFEYVLGAFAEITCFADRHFYADWWNSTNWMDFSREWNIPVHRFLQRHVYGASRLHMSRPVAMVVTYLISALAHELVMFCITKKLRGYGFVCQMLQLPFMTIQKSKWMRDKAILNNILFWMSMIWGLSMICALYVLV